MLETICWSSSHSHCPVKEVGKGKPQSPRIFRPKSMRSLKRLCIGINRPKNVWQFQVSIDKLCLWICTTDVPICPVLHSRLHLNCSLQILTIENMTKYICIIYSKQIFAHIPSSSSFTTSFRYSGMTLCDFAVWQNELPFWFPPLSLFPFAKTEQ